MASYLRRFFTNFKWLLLIIVVLFAILTIVCNIIVSSLKSAITVASDKYLTPKISVSKVVFLPPNLIILKNASIRQEVSDSERQLLRVPSILITFSLREFLLKKHLYISNIKCTAPHADYYEFCQFVRENFSQIIDFIRHLPRQNIKFSIKNAALDLAKEENNYSYMSVYCDLKIKDGSIWVSGYVREDREKFFIKGGHKKSGKTIGSPLQYNLKGELAADGVKLNKLEFMRENLYSQLWGSCDGITFKLNGFALANTVFRETFSSEPRFKISDVLEKFKILLHKQQEASERFILSKADFYLLDLNSQINLTFPKIKIEHLNFSLNNIPYSIKGEIVFNNPISLDLMLSSYFANLKDVQENLKKVDVKVAGLLQNKTYNGDAMLNLDFVRKKKGSPPLEQLQCDLKALNLRFDQYPKLAMSFKEGHLFCRTDTNEYSVLLEDFNSLFNLQHKRFKLVKFHSLFYDGFLYGQGRIDMAAVPPKVTSVVRVREVSANKLDGILIHFSKVFGKLSGVMYFNNHPDLDLKGRTNVGKGYLDNFEFFKWLAQLFDIPGLRRIDFNRASSNFSANAKGAGLHKISLDSKDVNLNGYFTLGENDWVSSKLSLTLTRDLLGQSPKFTPLLRLLSKDFNSLNFDFQLSGILHKMNFHWLQSDFKRKLQEAIPHFIETRIDKNIEEIIESISAQPQQ
jgi:hypothetical protein